jgi:ferrous iron transport protein B
MMDIVRKRGDSIDLPVLSRALSCPIVEISALKNDGIEAAADMAVQAAEEGKPVHRHIFSGDVEHAIAHIEEATVHHLPETLQRWYAVKIFERDKQVIGELGIGEETLRHIESDILDVERQFDDDSESIVINDRYEFITRTLSTCFDKKSTRRQTISDKIDRIVTNRVLALPIFVAAMFLVYYISIGSIGDWTVGFMNDTLFGEWIIPAVAGFLTNLGVAPWLVSLVADGIVGGVGAVVGFLPLVMIMYFLLALLEDCGYMARVSAVMDPIFKRVGLSGKAIIPIIIGTGCGIPAIMATRSS